MSNNQTLIERNADFAVDFDGADLNIKPRLTTLIVGCVDARVDPAHFLGLEPGDAVVMRNIGGRVTDEVIEHVTILQTLGASMMGVEMDVAIIHHTQCGASMFTMPDVANVLVTEGSIGRSSIEALAITDADDSVRIDIERLRSAPTLPDQMHVAGYVYDVQDGHLREVVSSTALREPTLP